MTDPVANVGSEQQIAELPKNKESEVEVEGVDHVTLSENHVDKQSSESPKEADFSDKTKPVEISVEDGLPLKPDNAGNMLLEGGDGTNLEKPLCDPPLEKQIDYQAVAPITQIETVSEQRGSLDVKAKEDNEIDSTSLENKNGPVEINARECHAEDNQNNTTLQEENTGEEHSMPAGDSNRSFTFEPGLDGNDSGSEEEQSAFMRELENFHRERSLEFKPPKFYGEGLNCLKLWRTVARLGGYDQVTVGKLWRQVGESFNPPKTCTTISWSFRNFYEKALLEYEKYKIQSGELKFSTVDLPGSTNADNLVGGNQASGSGRAVRDAAARAMQGWHTQRLFDGGEAGDPIMKDKNSPFLKRDKQHKSIGPLKKRKAAKLEHEAKLAKTDPTKPLDDIVIIDVGVPADWVKINVQRTAYIEQFYCPDGNVSFKQHDCFEVYALVPGLLREEVQVQSDPAGRLIISGEPEQPDNPWGVTAFKKVITLPARIDPHQTSAVVTLHGQLLVRAPLEVPGV